MDVSIVISRRSKPMPLLHHGYVLQPSKNKKLLVGPRPNGFSERDRLSEEQQVKPKIDSPRPAAEGPKMPGWYRVTC